MTDENQTAEGQDPEIKLIDAEEVTKHLFALTSACEADVPAIEAGTLEHEDILIDRILAAAFDEEQEMPSEGDCLMLVPALNEQVVLTAALSAAVGAVTHFARGEVEGAEILERLNQEVVEDMFAAQYKAGTPFQNESFYRMVAERPNETWPEGCPLWLSIWFDVFSTVIISLKTRVKEARQELRNRVGYVEAGVRNARRLAQSDLKREEKEEARKERLRKMTERRKKAEAAKREDAAAAKKPAPKPAPKKQPAKTAK